MQPGSFSTVRALRTIVSIACLASSVPASADEFEAFTWARHHPASTAHVTPLIQIDPWVNTDLNEVSAKLKALPEGKRFVILQGITEDLADHPQDRVVERTWQLRTRQVAVPTGTKATPAPARGSATLASQGRAPGSAAAATASKATTTTVTERVPVDRLTQFRGPWMDNGIRAVRTRVQSIVTRLRSLGTPIDGIAVANETTLHAACFLSRDGALAAIQSDPRWPALAAAMGMSASITDMWWGSGKYLDWSERMAGRFDAAMNQAVFAPVRAAYPNAVVSNYCSGRIAAQYATPDINGHPDRFKTAGFGTHDNFEFYGWLAHWRIEKTRGDEPVDDAWLAFRVEMHKIRGMNASSPRPKHAWIAQRSWEGEAWGRVPFASGALWDELVLQLGMHGVRQFFELSIEDFGMSTADNLARRADDRAALDSLLAELNQRAAGSSSGILVAAQPSWNDRVVATGRRVGDRVVWRFSFAPGIEAVKVRFTDGSDAIVSVEDGRRGTWFEHDAARQLQLDASGRMPVVEVVPVQPEGSGGGTQVASN